MMGDVMDDRAAREAVTRIILGYVRENPWMSLGGFVTTLVTPLQDVVLPHLTGRIVNTIKADGGGGSLLPSFVAVGVAVVLLQIGFVLQDVVDAKLFPAMQTYVRRVMLSCVLNTHDTAQQGELETGDILAKFVKVPFVISNWFETAKMLLPNVLVYFAATAYFFWMDAVLGAGVLVTVAVTFLSLGFNLASCGQVSEDRDRAVNAMQENIDELLRNLPAVYASGRKDSEQELLRPREEAHEDLYFRTSMCSNMVKLWMVPTTVGLVAFVLWRCGRLLASGRFSAGQFVSAFIVVIYMMMSMMRMVQHSRAMVNYWGVIKASIDTMTGCGGALSSAPLSSAPLLSAPRQREAAGHPILRLDHVSYTHPSASTAAVADANLDLHEGDRLAIVGQMGSGKTMLLRLIMRLLEPSSGRLLLRGAPYASYTVEDVRRTFGYVPQGAPLFDRSVLENATYGTSPQTAEQVWDAVRRLGLDAVFGALPLGLDTPAGKAGTRLSGGQRQAVWLVRMMLIDPDVLVLDEPTSAMDPESRDAVAKAVSEFRTVVIVTHDMAIVKGVANRVAVMDRGTLRAEERIDAEDACGGGEITVNLESYAAFPAHALEET